MQKQMAGEKVLVLLLLLLVIKQDTTSSPTAKSKWVTIFIQVYHKMNKIIFLKSLNCHFMTFIP